MYKRKTTLPKISGVTSATECTGLMPTLPLDDAEFDSYSELYSMGIPELEIPELEISDE